MTDDKMPPPASVLAFAEALNGQRGAIDAWLECNDEAEVRAHVRAYAAEQVRDLVGELERINDWCCYATEEDISARLLALQQIGQAVRALIAKHKGAP